MLLTAAFFQNLAKNLQGEMNLWTLFGLVGNLLFASRFVVQWYVSEKLKRSVIPIQFWYLSIAGSLFCLIYAVHVGKIAFILGFLFPTVIYARNLMLIASGKKSSTLTAAGPADEQAGKFSTVAPSETRAGV
jgi:lipid-A-disaccharide synthase-like uncharacterized protein